MKRFVVMVALCAGISAVNANTPTNLDELLDQVKRERVLEQQQNKLRETEFIEARDRQAALLREARRELAAQEARTEELNAQFEENEAELAEREFLLTERSGSLGELFGTARQVANDTRSILTNSVTSLNNSERIEFLEKLSEARQQPTIDELRELWLILQAEMTNAGKVEVINAPVITVNGEVEQRDVTRIGLFTVFSDGKFMRFIPETGDLVELARQPLLRFQKLASDFERAQSGQWEAIVVDPTRGGIMALLVQKPNLKERVQLGGWIGYTILILGAIGLLTALSRYFWLSNTERAVKKQKKSRNNFSDKNPLGRVMSVYNPDKNEDVETLELKLDEAILRETPAIERGLTILATMAAVAPMLGLLGTVSGMIQTFQVITLFGTGDPKLMSGGISEALVTTELGLIVAIPLLLIHSSLSSKSNRLVQTLDEESAALIAQHAEKTIHRDG